MYKLSCSMTLPLPIADVFAFFENPANLARITPGSMGFQVITPPPLVMQRGALIDYTIRWAGLPMRWTTLITDYDPPHSFVDTQLRGPYPYWHHRHTFSETPEGTRIGDEVTYMLPFGPLGRVVHALLVRRQLAGIFAYRQQAIRRILLGQVDPAAARLEAPTITPVVPALATA